MNHASPSVLQGSLPEALQVCAAGGRWKDVKLAGVIRPAFNIDMAYPQSMASLVLPVRDDSDVPGAWYDMAVEFHRAFSPTFVHCVAGQNRSVMFGAAILFADGMDLNEALKKLATVPVFSSILASLTRWAAGRGWKGTVTIASNGK